MLPAAVAHGQHGGLNSASFLLPEFSEPTSLDTQGRPQNQQPAPSGTSGNSGNPKPSSDKTPGQGPAPSQEQPKRILGMMPNYGAVSAGKIPPPPTPKQALLIATQNSFDYSAFLLVGLTSALAEGTNAHPQLGKGLPGFGRYYWRGFVDETDANYLMLFALPTLFHQDERYFAMGYGSVWKRIVYSTSRVVITPDYRGHSSFNISELLGRGIAEGVSAAYYPSRVQTVGGVATKFGYAVLRDALTDAFREFWPDITVHVLHRHP
jgi:hypothetical protein